MIYISVFMSELEEGMSLHRQPLEPDPGQWPAAVGVRSSSGTTGHAQASVSPMCGLDV